METPSPQRCFLGPPLIYLVDFNWILLDNSREIWWKTDFPRSHLRKTKNTAFLCYLCCSRHWAQQLCWTSLCDIRMFRWSKYIKTAQKMTISPIRYILTSNRYISTPRCATAKRRDTYNFFLTNKTFPAMQNPHRFWLSHCVMNTAEN